MQPKSRTGQGVRVLCLDRARRHFSYRHGMAPGPRKGADMLFPQHEAAVAGSAMARGEQSDDARICGNVHRKGGHQ